MCWFYDDGRGQHRAERAPSADLDEGLRGYLTNLQANIDRL
jgi:hypothetical protein